MRLTKKKSSAWKGALGGAIASGEEFILPVDSPDEEHAVFAAMSNAVAFTSKTTGGSVHPIAFCCTAVRERS